MDFPSTIPAPQYPMDYEPEDNSIRTKFEDGTVQSRLKFTRSRKTWKLTWKNLKQNYFSVLDNFVVNVAKHSANRFNWLNPTNNTTYLVICTKYNARIVTVDQWDVELELQEV